MPRRRHPSLHLITHNRRTIRRRSRPIQHHLPIPTRCGKGGHPRRTRWRGRNHRGTGYRNALAINGLRLKLIRFAISQPCDRRIAGGATPGHRRPTRPVLTRIGNPLPHLICVDRDAVGRSRPTQRHLTIATRRCQWQRDARRLRRGCIRRRRTRAHAIDRPHGELILRAIGQPCDRRIAGGAPPRHDRPSRPAMPRCRHPSLHLIAHNRRTIRRRSRPRQHHLPIAPRCGKGRCPRRTRWRGRLDVGHGHRSALAINGLRLKLIRDAIGQPCDRRIAGGATPGHRRPSRPVLTRIGNPLPHLICVDSSLVRRSCPTQHHQPIATRCRQR